VLLQGLSPRGNEVYVQQHKVEIPPSVELDAPHLKLMGTRCTPVRYVV